ncbi:MAG: replication/maintenance protein RepL [Ahrensia sp.]|nr:replication/maintenance protein RepL [Ahrensia sp.]
MISERYKTNPFITNMVLPVKGQKVKLSRLGKDDNILLNQSTGETHGTHITTYRKVDGAQFIKLFTENIGLTFDLSAAGIKAFSVLLWLVQHNAFSKDQVDLDSLSLEEFIASNSTKKLSLPTFKRGISELEKSQIIAKTMRKGRYFINPNFMFNGDRIAFSTVLERDNSGIIEDQSELDI